MKFTFKKYPIDVITFLAISLIILPIGFLDIDTVLRLIIGLPFILIIPGYLLIFTLFPSKKKIDAIQRITLSIGFSIAIVPFMGFILNYTRWGLRLESSLFSIFSFILFFAFTSLYRWYLLDEKDRFIISFDISFFKNESKLDKILTIFLIASIVISIVSMAYVLTMPKQGEKFTQFYLVPLENSNEYPTSIGLDEKITGSVGIVNHEYERINYTVEIWLLDQEIIYNETTLSNETNYENMWFLDKIEISLNHYPLKIDDVYTSQWEHNFSFDIEKFGTYKLTFLLFTESTENYEINKDYKNIANEKLNNAYREVHLWITLYPHKFYLLDSTGGEENYQRNLLLGENISGFLGIIYAGNQSINYTIDAWLINESTEFSNLFNKTLKTIHNMWFIDTFKASFNGSAIIDKWLQNYSFKISKKGTLKIAFYLFIDKNEEYLVGKDYLARYDLIIDDYQKELNIFLNVI